MAGRGGGRRAHRKPRGNQWQIGSEKHVREGRHRQVGGQRFSGGGQGSWIPSESPPPLSALLHNIFATIATTCTGADDYLRQMHCTASVPPTFNPSVLASLELSLSLLPAFGSASVCLHRRCVYQVDGQSQDRFLDPRPTQLKTGMDMLRQSISPYQVCCC